MFNWAHTYGFQVENALSLVDSMIDYLMQRLYDAQLIGCLNMVIVADHGMVKLFFDVQHLII